MPLGGILNFELVSPAHWLKFEAPDGKQRIADVLNSEDVLLLANRFISPLR